MNGREDCQCVVFLMVLKNRFEYPLLLIALNSVFIA